MKSALTILASLCIWAFAAYVWWLLLYRLDRPHVLPRDPAGVIFIFVPVSQPPVADGETLVVRR